MLAIADNGPSTEGHGRWPLPGRVTRWGTLPRMPRADIQSSTRLVVAPAAAALALVGTMIATAAGLTPAPLLVAVCVLLAAALALSVGWVQAAALAPLAMAATFLSLGQVYPDVDLPWATANTAVLGVIGALALAALVRAGGIRPIPREARWLVLAALSVPVVCVSWLYVVGATSSTHKLAWLMSDDSAFNVFSSRHVLLDGGVDPAKHPSPAPGMSEVAALFTAPGRSGVARSALLEHDVERILQALVLATGALSVLGALGAVLVVRRGHLLPRVTVAVAVAVLPWTWYLFGYATQYGFWNARNRAPAVLGAAWLAFAERRRHPTAASAAQALAGTALLPLWAPLLLVPALFGMMTVVHHRREHLALRRSSLVAWLAPVVLLGWYVLFVTIPLIDGDTSALAADGAMLAMSRTSIVVILLAARRSASWSTRAATTGELAGPVLVLVAGLIGLAYLVGQRADAPTGPWGYYPAKFGWLLAFVAFLAAARSAVALAFRGTTRPQATSTVERSRMTSSGAGSLPRWPGPSGSVLWPGAAGGPAADHVRPPGACGHSRLARGVGVPAGVHESARRRQRASILRWRPSSGCHPPARSTCSPATSEDSSLDAFVNFWLLSQPVVQDHNDVRWYAYFLEPDKPESLCNLAITWGPGLRS